eukprot:1159911-Pelagomonas_calceolata.AAC.2
MNSTTFTTYHTLPGVTHQGPPLQITHHTQVGKGGFLEAAEPAAQDMDSMLPFRQAVRHLCSGTGKLARSAPTGRGGLCEAAAPSGNGQHALPQHPF